MIGTVDGGTPLEYAERSGISATWDGTASRATVAMNSHSLPRKSIQANAYAAKAAMAIGMIVATMAIEAELSNAFHSPAPTSGNSTSR
jgi:ribosomal protein L18